MEQTGVREDAKMPVKRSRLRLKLGTMYYGARRWCLWLKMRGTFARERLREPLEYTYFTHRTPMLRRLRNVDMWMQHNKVTNLRLAVKKLNGIVIHPGETFSYWYLIGMPTRLKGYKKGMILRNGHFEAGIGGGMCQFSNLIFWMAIHTPLTVTERHRHSYDVFPDSNRTQPFASGATCSYPHVDLMIRNDTDDDYQILLNVGDEYLEGEIRSSAEPQYRFEVTERGHEMRHEFWGGYTRRNEIWRQVYDRDGNLVDDSLLIKNCAIMMYTPYLSGAKETD